MNDVQMSAQPTKEEGMGTANEYHNFSDARNSPEGMSY